MNRLEISSAYTGPSNFTCPVNPYSYDPVDNSQLERIDILHGAATHQEAYFDDRIRTFTWPAYELSNSNISSIVTYFRSIKGEVRYFHFQDIATMNTNWPTTAVSTSDSNWKYGRIIDLDIKYRPGGKLRYDTLTLYVQPETP